MTWSAHTNATAGDHIDHVVNEKSLDSRLNYGEPEDETDGAQALAQRKAKRFTQFKPVQSTVGSGVDPEWPEWTGPWNNMQAGHTNEAEWEAHIAAVGADYLDSAKTAPEEIKADSSGTAVEPMAAITTLAQRSKAHKKRIYPVADSSSYISPYV